MQNEDDAAQSGPELIGRTIGTYEIERLIGKGGGGTVYRARSTVAGPAGETGVVAAIKIFHRELITDERVFARFQREAELGILIRHPHVVRTYETGCEEIDGADCHFMAMEFVEGETLRELLTDLKVLPEHLVYQVADQVLDALGAVHQQGMIHRDIKPENIVLTEEQEVRVMDLGVARLQQEGRDLTRAGEFVGSLAYAAPEQFVNQDAVDPRADLYAVGVLLYEMATGKNPYDIPDLGTLLRQKLQGEVRRPKTVNRDLDPFLDEIILTCLRSEPNERFASSEELRGVLKEGTASAWWRERIKGESFPAAMRALGALRVPRDAPLIDRASHLEKLHGAFERAQGGTFAVAMLSGSEGTGKSRLLHDFAEELVAPDGPRIWAARCMADGGRSCQAPRDALAGFLGEPESRAARLQELLPSDPALAAAIASRELPPDDLAAAFVAIIKSLADRPLVLALEDLHQADDGTCALLGSLARSLGELQVLLVVSYRRDLIEESAGAHELITALGQLDGAAAISLDALGRDAQDELVQALVKLPRTVRGIGYPLSQASDGNPRFLLDIVAHLKQTGALVERDEGHELDQPINEIELPESMRQLFGLKLDGLDAPLMETLHGAAVQGVEFDPALLATITGQKKIRLLKRLAQLEKKHGLLLSAGKMSFHFATHGLQRVVYDRISEHVRIDLHAKCADAIADEPEPLQGARAFRWAHHLLHAGRIAEAGNRLDAALEHAARDLHAAEGVPFLERVAEALDATDLARLLNIAMKLANLHGYLGHANAERRGLAKALTLANRIDQPGPIAQVQAAFAAASLRAANFTRAESEAMHGMVLAARVDDDAVQGSCLHTLGGVEFRRGNGARAVEHWNEALEFRRRVGDRRGEAATLLQLGAAMPDAGDPDRALELKQEALQILRDVADRGGEGAALNNIGNALVDAARIDEALVCYEQSICIARELGNLPAEANALYNMARVHVIDARIEKAQETFERALDIFREIEDPGGEAGVLDELGSAMAHFGDTQRALALLREARTAAEQTGERLLLVRILRHLATVQHEAGARDEAWALFDRSLSMTQGPPRSAILSDMGNAAEREGDFDRATTLLEESLSHPTASTRALLSLCRLARAHQAAGRVGQAQQTAERAEAILTGERPFVPQHGPEVYYSLGTVLAGEPRGREYLQKASELLGERTRSIRSVVYREHYLTTRYPNREILEESRRQADG